MYKEIVIPTDSLLNNFAKRSQMNAEVLSKMLPTLGKIAYERLLLGVIKSRDAVFLLLQEVHCQDGLLDGDQESGSLSGSLYRSFLANKDMR